MQTVTIKQTRNNLASIIDQVAIGKKKFTITKFGKPRAKIVPITSEVVKKVDRKKILQELQGVWKHRDDIDDTLEYAKKLRQQAMSRT